MVQLFDSQASYPSTSIVAYHNGLFQTLSSSSPASTPLSSPWTYLGTDISGIPTPQAQLLASSSQPSALFDEAEELSLAAEDAFNVRDFDDTLGEWEHLSRPSSSTAPLITNAPNSSNVIASASSYKVPPPPHDCTLADKEAHFESSAHILKAELVGEFVFKTNSRGCFAYNGESVRRGSEEEMIEKLREDSFRDVLGDDKFGGEDSEKRAAWLDGALARKEYYSLPGAVGPDCQWILVTAGEDFPENALPIGCESTSSPSSKILFAARGYHEFSVQIGKAGLHLGSPRHSFATSTPPGRESFFYQNTFEILCTSSTPSTSTPTKWITVPSHMMGDEVRELMRGERPVEGGRERNGTWLGVGRGSLKGGEHPGKVRFGSNQISIGWGGKEWKVSGYQLLVYA